ncbi:MAG: hydantoinase/oxoprolinase family protein [Candidatus Dormibacteraceae bacterium]
MADATSSSLPGFRLGVDIGGTFTDAILLNEQSGEWRIAKVPSTPGEPALGFMAAVRKIVDEADLTPRDVALVVHGSTVATNAIIEGKTAVTAFVTTSGFRDMLEIARQMRPSLYDLQFEKPRPLVPRRLAFEVSERIGPDGKEIEPIGVESVLKVASFLRGEGIESIAICLLHSYANPDHERKVAQIIAGQLPEVLISMSSEVAPEIREYFRASTTVVNAAIRPIVGRYLSSIRERLKADGFEAEALVMQSNGGIMSFASAAEKPVFMVESGPAAGVVAAAQVARVSGLPSVISFDMGGTTAKVGLVRDASPVVTKDFEVGTHARPGIGGIASGSGYPIRAPVVELVEIGAGGGSLAWVDQGGGLRVGPESAGADPGPACYGHGGSRPTITDANLVLGRLNPANFLGGDMSLDVDAAAQAIVRHCAEPLNIDVVQAAHGIVEIANVAMTNAIRLISVRRGYDPREYALVAFGGAGPLHACRLAAELEIPLIIVPPSPGTASALGLLVSDLRHDYSRTIRRLTRQIDDRELDQSWLELELDARRALSADGIQLDRMSFRRYLEMRYAGQSYELTVELAPQSGDSGVTAPEGLVQAEEKFHLLHAQLYGHAAKDEPTMIVNLRVTGVGHIPKPNLRLADNARTGLAGRSHRDVYFAERGGFVDVPTILRHTLPVGAEIVGPAVIEEMDSTTVLHPGYSAGVDEHGNLRISPSLS